MAWIWVAMPAAAARPVDAASSSGGVTQNPRRRSGGTEPAASGSMSARRPAVREPIDPSAKHFCQPIRARPSGFAPSDAPLRRPRAMAVSSASLRRLACTRTGSRPVSARCAYAGNENARSGSGARAPGS